MDLAEKVMFIGGESINIIDENMGKCNQDISSGGNGKYCPTNKENVLPRFYQVLASKH